MKPSGHKESSYSIILYSRYRPGRTMEITGWGKVLKIGGENKRNLTSPTSLQEAMVPIISQKLCQDDSVSIQHYITITHIHINLELIYLCL